MRPVDKRAKVEILESVALIASDIVRTFSTLQTVLSPIFGEAYGNDCKIQWPSLTLRVGKLFAIRSSAQQ
jgi:hypothetical protein